MPASLTQAQAAAQDPAKIAAAIKGSYYHPDSLPGLECDVKIDWPALLEQMKFKVSEDRLKVFETMKIRSRAPRNQPASIDFDWSGGPPEGSRDIQDGVQKMVGGYYQMYWPIVAKSPIQKASDITRSEPQSDGTLKVVAGNEGASLALNLDKDMTPVHYSLDYPGMKAEFAMHYEDSPHPEPGDLRRLVGMDVVEQIGTSNLNVNLKLGYQQVAEYLVPQKVSFEVVGAYSINLEFSACTVMSAPASPK